VPLVAGVNPPPCGAKHSKSDDHHQTDGNDEIHARPLFTQKNGVRAKVKGHTLTYDTPIRTRCR